MKHLSILIPTYNDACLNLVQALQQQARQLDTEYEIIVADDGSTDETVRQTNRAINLLDHCRMIEREENYGRAVIRNFLAQQAQYEWLVFIDSDMVVVNDHFLKNYALTEESDIVIDGGVCIGNVSRDNLRSLYEQAAEQQHTAERRQRTPYQHLHTANLMIRKDILLLYPFDERFRHYGYEDVLLGKRLQEAAIPIKHINNPLSFEIFETNEHFVSKTEEGLRTLHQFQTELQGFSNLLTLSKRLRIMAPLIRLWHNCVRKKERHNLVGSHPNLTVFALYRLGYFFSL